MRELSRATASVLEEVSAGKRMVITRHGNPVALILSIDDATELFLAHAEEFVRMRLAAREELDAAREELDADGDGLDAREELDRSTPVTRLQMHLSVPAAGQLEELHRRRRGRLKREIEKVASSAPDGRFIQVGTEMDVAAGEVIDDDKTLLVYAVIPRRELLRRIWGPGVDGRFGSRRVNRVMRGRT